MFLFIKKVFFGLLTEIVNISNYTTCLSLKNQQCMTQPTLINLHCNKYTQGLRNYSFAFQTDRYFGSFNTLNDLYNKAYVPNKTEDLHLCVFNMIT